MFWQLREFTLHSLTSKAAFNHGRKHKSAHPHRTDRMSMIRDQIVFAKKRQVPIALTMRLQTQIHRIERKYIDPTPQNLMLKSIYCS